MQVERIPQAVSGRELLASIDMTTLKKCVLILIGGLGLVFGSFSHANLLINGGFEDPDVGGSVSQENPANVPGWESEQDIEIWNNISILDSFEGGQHIELNSRGDNPWSIWQDFTTSPGDWYSLYFYAARRDSGNESFRVDVLSETSDLLLTEVVSLTSNDWTRYSFDFTAAGTSSRLQFTSITPTRSRGNLIDAVTVVPSPATLSLVVIGLLAARLRRPLLKGAGC